MPEEIGPAYELGLDVKVWEEDGLWHAANMNGDDLVLILTAKTQDAIHAEIRKVAQEVFDLIWEERPADEKIEDYAARLGVTCKGHSLRRHGALFGSWPFPTSSRPCMIPSKAQLDRVMDCLGYAPWRGAGWYRTNAGSPSPSLVRLSIGGPDMEPPACWSGR